MSWWWVLIAVALTGALLVGELAWVNRPRIIRWLAGRPLPGCCGACDSYGYDASAPETGGRCWDCYGTGHAHTGRCRQPRTGTVVCECGWSRRQRWWRRGWTPRQVWRIHYAHRVEAHPETVDH